ncbi:MAG: NAD(P)H-binding protein [Rudanella sp.]|nr:NAD(P)H-binding protein [Rudanella sp.]
MKQTISIIGLGWLGGPLAHELTRQGHQVLGSTTSPEKQTQLQAVGIDAYLLNLAPQPKGDLEALLNATILVVNVPPKAGKFGDDFHPTQMKLLAEAVQKSAVRWVIYVSSTSVYPELSRIMTEADVQTPDQSAAPALVRAEQMWLGLQTDVFRVTILRCGGLMGYERQAGKYVAGRTVNSGAAPVNYIHRDDAVGLICAVIEKQLTGVYNMVAPQHPSRANVYRESCKKHGYELPILIEPTEPVAFKLISSAEVIRQTGYVFQYANPLDFP